MVLTFVLVLLIAFGGFLLTYLFAEKETFLWRFSTGNIIGSAIFGSVGFVIANLSGLSTATASLALLVTLAPLALYAKANIKKKFWIDWHNAKNRATGTSFKMFLRAAYYVAFFLLFVFFFDRAMFETNSGIFTGASQNLGDLPFHLGAIFSFTEGNNFPPQNPSFANAKFSYPFIADLLTALVMKFGADVKSVMLVQNIGWAFALLVILERFVFKLTNNKLAAKIAPVLLFFSGGLGFLWFAKDFWEGSQSFFELLWKLPRDYTIGEKIRWGNSLVVLFITQRSLLLGMPLTLIALQKLWELFTAATQRHDEKGEFDKSQEISAVSLFTSPYFFVGLLAGTLPLIHLHSLIVLFVVTAFLCFIRTDKWREWIVFGAGVAIIAVPELLWAMSGTATRTNEFFGWHFGWNKGKDENVVWFWLKNTGIFIPLFIAATALLFSLKNKQIAESEAAAELAKIKDQRSKTKDQRPKIKDQTPKINELLIFFLPFLFLFVVSNTAKLAPWEWDNIKILIYCFIGALPFVSMALAWGYNQNIVLKIAAVGCSFLLIFSGALDVWRTVSGQVKHRIFDAEAVELAEKIRLRTAPNALFLNAPTYNSAVVLTGRRSLMRYIGHLSSHGIDYNEREEDLKRIYEGSATADMFLRKYNIEYVLISPEERGSLTVNEEYFKKFPLLTEVGEYKVYKVK